MGRCLRLPPWGRAAIDGRCIFGNVGCSADRARAGIVAHLEELAGVDTFVET